MNVSLACAKARQFKGREIKERLDLFSQPDGTGCRIWVGPSTTQRGYGLIYYNGKKRLAHRVSYEVYVGPIPKGKQIMHACDKVGCVNPGCLSVGTQYENEQDKMSKGRHMHGVTHYNAKLTEAQVRAIRVDTRSRQVIATEYDLHPATISMIRGRRIWRHLT